ncbi:MAG: hypothetical protein U9N63_14455, partial [Pseudomonadota bacterium]|nr:hypothetical protein [Pseudomonadota bacterium]
MRRDSETIKHLHPLVPPKNLPRSKTYRQNNVKISTTSLNSYPTVKIAPVPPQIIPKSFATAALLAYIIIAKFIDALPLYRQES